MRFVVTINLKTKSNRYPLFRRATFSGLIFATFYKVTKLCQHLKN